MANDGKKERDFFGTGTSMFLGLSHSVVLALHRIPPAWENLAEELGFIGC